jgi:dolichol-phosphate mannosyltransferase
MDSQTQTKTSPPVTVIVPCFNEDEGIPALMGRLAALHANGGRGWEVLLVDDGSVDSDCTYPPERLPELVRLLDDGSEIATASAWHPESQAAEGSAFRIMLSRAVSGCYKLLIGQDVHTFTCLFRAYRTDALRRIRFRSDGFAAVAEIMLRSMLAGYRVRELPMRLEKRRYGESKLKVGDAIAAHAGLLSMTAALVGSRWVRGHLRRRNDGDELHRPAA